MPVADSQPRRALLVGIAGVVAAVALFFLVVSLTGNDVEVRFGDDRFEVGPAEARAATIERDRTPLLFSDPSGGSRPIWVQHLGDDANEGWMAFDAQVGGCALDWDVDAQELVDQCTGSRYPADGDGLVHYPTTVEDGKVVVDVSPEGTSTTT